MKYFSTRGKTSSHRFLDVLLTGLAPDGGLFVPETYPRITQEDLERWRTLPYAELAYQVIRLFIDDIPEKTLRAILQHTYQQDAFDIETIITLDPLHDGLYIEGLSHGPTLAFKDMAMQLLGHLLEYALATKNQTLNIVGATSGDTGSAAEYALRNKRGIQVFMLSPSGKMSAFQRAQMYSLQDANIHNIAITGMFDDCQDIVKAVQNDALFKEKCRIGTINSINWARILAQIVYYIAGYIQATNHGHKQVSFCVPSGNFGNVCAGHIAKQMGLPIARLIVATNENDVLHEFFHHGVYRPRKNHETYTTSSPSMDISKASNIERFIFDLLERKSNIINDLWKNLSKLGGFDLSHKLPDIHQHYGFFSGRSHHQNRLATIALTKQKDNRLIDPHTADGIYVARALRQPNETIVVLETASPIKFSETIEEATGQHQVLPLTFQAMMKLPQRVTTLPASTALVKDFIHQTLKNR
ncbi:MAG: threonine synthase [Neisseriales bacterium]|nr:MAG: threonine synthase [Neisseriales bacterium]